MRCTGNACKASIAPIRLVPRASSQPTPSTSPVAFQRVEDQCGVMPSPLIFGVFIA
jgi:hypothetical protein